MVDLTLLVGNSAVVCTIASNFAGLPVCLDMVRKKSTAGVSCLPFLSAAICTAMWLQYGILVGDAVLSVVNLIAVFMQCCYLGCFFHATTHKASLAQWLVSSSVLLLSVHAYSFRVADRETAVQTLGLFSSCGSICACAAPLTGLKEVFSRRSTEKLPFLIIFGSFVVTVLWYTYGVLIDDSFIKVPNLIGALLSGFQLSLFAIFESKTDRSKSD